MGRISIAAADSYTERTREGGRSLFSCPFRGEVCVHLGKLLKVHIIPVADSLDRIQTLRDCVTANSVFFLSHESKEATATNLYPIHIRKK